MIDYSAPYSSNRRNKVRVTMATLAYSFVFFILTAMTIANLNPLEKDPDAVVHAKVLNIVYSSMKSGASTPLIYDLEFISPALQKQGFETADYYKAEAYFKTHGKFIKNKNGYYYATRVINHDFQN